GVGAARGGFWEGCLCPSKMILLPATATVASPATPTSTVRREMRCLEGGSQADGRDVSVERGETSGVRVGVAATVGCERSVGGGTTESGCGDRLGEGAK